ncbi:choline/carnitine/betaine transporter [Pseudomonas putida S11]|nr:choline/carnitine/betaine transporter [Pseudomonas putida S11]
MFYFAASFILIFGLVVISYPQAAGDWLLAAQNWAANTVGWYYMLAMTLYLVFVVVTALSGYGKIKLGADHDEPEFSYLSWAGMLFAAGISITLFFFCVSEPLTHMLQPPQGEAGTAEAGRQAMQILFLHWGLHGWGVFAFVGMALAYFAYRHNLPLALRSALYPLIGKRINGPIGYAVDGFGIIATVFGLGADMGFGVLHLNAGLDYLFGIDHSQWVQVLLITLMMGAAVAVAVAGVEKGVRVMSDINLFLACALLLFVLFAGPTQHLFNTLIQNLRRLPGCLAAQELRRLCLRREPRLAGRLDGVLLGLVDCLGAVRGPVHRPHLPWPHHPRVRLWRAVDSAGLHPGVDVDLRQQRPGPGHQPRHDRAGPVGAG